jgi:hypothetical protein
VDVCCASGTGRIGANKTEKKKKSLPSWRLHSNRNKEVTRVLEKKNKAGRTGSASGEGSNFKQSNQGRPH